MEAWTRQFVVPALVGLLDSSARSQVPPEGGTTNGRGRRSSLETD
jgi:hypothetical protein